MPKKIGLLTRKHFAPYDLAYRCEGLKRALESEGNEVTYIEVPYVDQKRFDQVDFTISLGVDYYIEGRPFSEKIQKKHIQLRENSCFSHQFQASPWIRYGIGNLRFFDFLEGEGLNTFYFPPPISLEGVHGEKEKEIDILLIGKLPDFKKIEAKWLAMESYLFFLQLLETGRDYLQWGSLKTLIQRLLKEESPLSLKSCYYLELIQKKALGTYVADLLAQLPNLRIHIASDDPKTWKKYTENQNFATVQYVRSSEEIFSLLKKSKVFIETPINRYQEGGYFSMLAPFFGALPILYQDHPLEASLGKEKLPFLNRQGDLEEKLRNYLHKPKEREEAIHFLKEEIQSRYTWEKSVDLLC